ncbi:MAG: hypothetical protein SGPRY_010024 [Prymnesium sp.]
MHDSFTELEDLPKSYGLSRSPIGMRSEAIPLFSLISESEQPESLHPRPHWIAFPDRRLRNARSTTGVEPGAAQWRSAAERIGGTAARGARCGGAHEEADRERRTRLRATAPRIALRIARIGRGGAAVVCLTRARRSACCTSFAGRMGSSLEWLIDEVLERDGVVCAQFDRPPVPCCRLRVTGPAASDADQRRVELRSLLDPGDRRPGHGQPADGALRRQHAGGDLQLGRRMAWSSTRTILPGCATVINSSNAQRLLSINAGAMSDSVVVST